MSSNKNSQIKDTPLVCFQIGKILKLRALSLFNLKWKEFLNQKHSLCLLLVNTLDSSSIIMHILWLPLRIQSHNAQSKKARLFTWIQMTLFLSNKREWFGYRMSWSTKKPIRRDYLLLIWKRKKWFFSKLTRTPHCKERFLHHKVLKGKFSSF